MKPLVKVKDYGFVDRTKRFCTKLAFSACCLASGLMMQPSVASAQYIEGIGRVSFGAESQRLHIKLKRDEESPLSFHIYSREGAFFEQESGKMKMVIDSIQTIIYSHDTLEVDGYHGFRTKLENQIVLNKKGEKEIELVDGRELEDGRKVSFDREKNIITITYLDSISVSEETSAIMPYPFGFIATMNNDEIDGNVIKLNVAVQEILFNADEDISITLKDNQSIEDSGGYIDVFSASIRIAKKQGFGYEIHQLREIEKNIYSIGQLTDNHMLYLLKDTTVYGVRLEGTERLLLLRTMKSFAQTQKRLFAGIKVDRKENGQPRFVSSYYLDSKDSLLRENLYGHATMGDLSKVILLTENFSRLELNDEQGELALLLESSSQTTGVEKKKIAKQDVMIYPNPLEDVLNIKLCENKMDVNEIKIFDMTGREVMKQMVFGQNKISIDVLELISGRYLLAIYSRGGEIVYRQRFLIKR
jgi:hypothetical protein